MNVKKRWLGTMLVLCMMVSVLGGCTIKTPGEGTTLRITKNFKENELFYLEEEVCTISEAKIFLMNQKNLYTSRYGAEIWTATYEGEPLYTYLEENLKDFLVRLKCMVLMAKANNITLSTEDQTLITLATNSYYKGLSEAELAYCDAAQQDINDAFSDYYLANKLYRVLTQDATKEISDDEARVISVQMIYLPFDNSSSADDQTEEGQSENSTEEQTEELAESATQADTETPVESEVQAETEAQAESEDQVTAEQLINELHKRATQGEEDFYSLAEGYSKGSWTEKQICRGEMESAFEHAAFALSSGAISKVVVGENGYYLIKCINNYEEELTAAHREELIEAWKQEVFKTAYDTFVGTLYLQFNDSLWEKIDFGAAAPDYTDSFYSCYEEFLSGNE